MFCRGVLFSVNLLVKPGSLCYSKPYPSDFSGADLLPSLAVLPGFSAEEIIMLLHFLRRLPLLALAGLSLIGLPAFAATLAVPAQYPTIQAAVNASANGDTVLIADGTYTGPGNVDIDFNGKNITVTSQNGAGTTIIDCGGSANANHRGFYLHSGETSAVISGLTIQNGYEYGDGGGIYNNSVGVTVQNCIVKGNTAVYGGGIYSTTTSSTFVMIINCVVTGNTANSNGQGGGLSNFTQNTGSIIVTNCTITGNYAPVVSGGTVSSGGGVTNYSYPAGTNLIKITNDILTSDVGGEVSGSGAFFGYCDIGDSTYTGSGSGIIQANPKFAGAPTDFHLLSGSPCLGAGTRSDAPATTLDGKSRPSPPSIGAYEQVANGSLATTTYLSSSSNPSLLGQSVTFTASVTSSSSAATGSITFNVDGQAQPPVTLTSGYYNYASYSTSSLAAGSHTITASYSGDTNFAPSTSSALTQTVNAGATTTTSLTSGPDPSVYRQPITLTATVTGSNPTGTVTFMDTTSGTTIGTSYLYQGTATFQTDNYPNLFSAGTHQIVAAYSGDSSSNASTSSPVTQTVQAAGTTLQVTSSLNPSAAGQSVLFAPIFLGQYGGAPGGTITFTVDGVSQPPQQLNSGYRPFYNTSTLAAGSHTVTAAYSGDSNFLSSTSPALTQVVNPHISPQYVSPLGSDSNPGTLAAPKLTIQAAINSALNGDTVIVEDGTYTGSGNRDIDFGGKNITVTSQHGAASTIIDCQGSSSANHRGFYLHSGETSAVISGFTIENGYEGNGDGTGNGNKQGGAIDDFSAGLTLQNCILKANTADYGGGVFSDSEASSPVTLISCVLSGNTAMAGGGGAYSYNASAAPFSLTNCLVIGNTAQSLGGGLYSFASTGSQAALTNCTFAGNMAVYGGSGLYNNSQDSSTVTAVNSIFYGDTGGEIQGTSVSVSSSDIQGGYAGTRNINADPLFAGYPNDLHLLSGSPCLSAGTASGAPATAIDGAARPNPPSIGAYEAYLAPTLVIVANVSGTAGQTVILQAALGRPGGTGLAGKTLAFRVDGAAAGTAGTNGSGTASLPFSLPLGFAAGSHTVTASFSGDAANSAASGTGTLTVSAPAGAAATQIKYVPRSGYEYRMVGGKFQGSTDGATYTDLYTITQAPARGVYTTVTLSSPAAYRFLRYLSPNNGYGNIAELEFDGGSGSSVQKISGTPFGTAGSYAGNGNTYAKAFDGSTGTFFDAPAANGAYAGIDQGAPAVRRGEIHFTPRSGYAFRMTGGKFQGSSDGVAYYDLYTIPAQPAQAAVTVVLPSDPKPYRYLRYLSPNNGYGNVAEVSFYSGAGTGAVKLTGTLFGTPGSYHNSGNDFTKAFDGSLGTFFDAPTSNGNFAGIDQGAP